MTKKLREAVRQQKQATNQKKPQLHGLLGLPLGGSKVVEVANRNSYVYVRLRNNQNEVIQAFNNQVAPAYNLPVIVERHGNRYTVIGVDTQRYENNWSSFAPFLPRHGNTHSFDMESGGGGDVVWVHTRQFMPMLVLPSGSAGAPNVIVSPYTLRKDNGTWVYVGNTGTANIAPYRPSTGAIMGLVYLNTNDGNPYLIINSGTIFPESLTGASQVVPYIPQIQSPSTQIPLAAIRLVTGTNRLSWDNIYDVRQFLHSVPTGTGGGGGSSTGTNYDDIYLRLDATNDPITGPTDIRFTGNPGNWGLDVRTVQSSPMRFTHTITGSGQFEDSSIQMARTSSVGGAGLTFEDAIIRVSQFLNAADTDQGGLLKYTSQGTERVVINPSVQGTGTMVMFDSDNSLSNDANLLLLKHEGNPKLKVNALGHIELGLGIPKEPNAGKIGYELVAPGGYLDIVGAGTTTPRWVRIYDRLRVEHAQVESFQNIGLTDSWIYLDATGIAVSPINAPEKTSPISADRILGMDSTNGNASVQFEVGDIQGTAETNENDIFRVQNPGGVSAFVGTIATLPGGATLTYNISSGQEAAMVPFSTSQLGKMTLHNTTRGTSALISNCVTASNTLTLTANVPAGWQVGDAITIASQTVSGGGFSWVDIKITSGLLGRNSVFVKMQINAVATNTKILIHPFDATFSGSKNTVLGTQASSINMDALGLIHLIDDKFCLAWDGSPAAIVVREAGYLK